MTSDLTYPILIGTSRALPSPIPGRHGNLGHGSLEHRSSLEHSSSLESARAMRSCRRRQRLIPVNPESPTARVMARTVLDG